MKKTHFIILLGASIIFTLIFLLWASIPGLAGEEQKSSSDRCGYVDTYRQANAHLAPQQSGSPTDNLSTEYIIFMTVRSINPMMLPNGVSFDDSKLLKGNVENFQKIFLSDVISCLEPEIASQIKLDNAYDQVRDTYFKVQRLNVLLKFGFNTIKVEGNESVVYGAIAPVLYYDKKDSNPTSIESAHTFGLGVYPFLDTPDSIDGAINRAANQLAILLNQQLATKE